MTVVVVAVVVKMEATVSLVLESVFDYSSITSKECKHTLRRIGVI